MNALLACVALIAPAGIPLGTSTIEVEVKGVKLEVYAYKPESYKGERMIMVFHGVLRNADEYRDHSKGMGDRFGALIIAPKFDAERFPSRRYQFGGILNAEGKAAPPEEWTYAFVPAIAQEIRSLEGKPRMKFWIIGHSAGGQFVARMSAFQATGAERHVAANPGSHLFPTRDLPFGYGFGNLPEELSSDEVLRRYLAAPLTIYLGTSDNAADEYFDSSANAMKQGAGRYQRGKACFALAKELAEKRGWAFNWRLVEAEGVGHDHEKMFDHPKCAEALFNSQG
jgi:pimeloyl-ACP methyl ester carboxylesterase